MRSFSGIRPLILSVHWAAKILKWLFFSVHHEGVWYTPLPASIDSVPLPVFAGIVSGFNQWSLPPHSLLEKKRHSEGSLEVLHAVSRCLLLLEMIHRSSLLQTFWDAHCLASRQKVSKLHLLPSAQCGRGYHRNLSSALLNYFVPDCFRSDVDVTSSTDYFTVLVFAPNRLVTILLRWVFRKQLTIALRNPVWSYPHQTPASPCSTFNCVSMTRCSQ